MKRLVEFFKALLTPQNRASMLADDGDADDYILLDASEPVAKKTPQEEIAARYITTLTIGINQTGKTEMYCTWMDSSEEVAMISADLMFKLTTGKLDKLLLDTLVQVSRGNIEQTKLSNKIIRYLRDFDKKPLIAPSSFLRQQPNQEQE